MRLSSLRIENFRSFEDETIPFDNYTCFVGPNGSGKSTILIALNIFFRNSGSSATDLLNLSEEDFHLKNTSRPVKITLTFDQLSDDAKVALKAYAIEDGLRHGPVHLMKHNKPSAVVLSEAAYARLAQGKAGTAAGMTAVQWLLLSPPASGTKRKAQLDKALREENKNSA